MACGTFGAAVLVSVCALLSFAFTTATDKGFKVYLDEVSNPINREKWEKSKAQAHNQLNKALDNTKTRIPFLLFVKDKKTLGLSTQLTERMNVLLGVKLAKDDASYFSGALKKSCDEPDFTEKRTFSLSVVMYGQSSGDSYVVESLLTTNELGDLGSCFAVIDVGKSPIANLIDDAYGNALGAVFGTHYDKDHIGALKKPGTSKLARRLATASPTRPKTVFNSVAYLAVLVEQKMKDLSEKGNIPCSNALSNGLVAVPVDAGGVCKDTYDKAINEILNNALEITALPPPSVVVPFLTEVNQIFNETFTTNGTMPILKPRKRNTAHDAGLAGLSGTGTNMLDGANVFSSFRGNTIPCKHGTLFATISPTKDEFKPFLNDTVRAILCASRGPFSKDVRRFKRTATQSLETFNEHNSARANYLSLVQLISPSCLPTIPDTGTLSQFNGSILMTGDSDARRINKAATFAGLDSKKILLVYKVSHHGSIAEGSNTDEIYSQIRAFFYLISGGASNHGNPKLEVLKMIINSRRPEKCWDSVVSGYSTPFYIVLSKNEVYEKEGPGINVFNQEIVRDDKNKGINTLRDYWSRINPNQAQKECSEVCFLPQCRRYGIIYLTSETARAAFTLTVEKLDGSTTVSAFITALGSGVRVVDCNSPEIDEDCYDRTYL